eukprot:3122838-Rhodomonas_salina.4
MVSSSSRRLEGNRSGARSCQNWTRCARTRRCRSPPPMSMGNWGRRMRRRRRLSDVAMADADVAMADDGGAMAGRR